MPVTQNTLDLVSQSTVIEEKIVGECVSGNVATKRKTCQFCGEANLMTMS